MAWTDFVAGQLTPGAARNPYDYMNQHDQWSSWENAHSPMYGPNTGGDLAGGNYNVGGTPNYGNIIGNILTGGYSLWQGFGGGQGTARGDAATAAAAADPFASQRPQYQQMLSSLLTTPGSFNADPGYQFAVDQGTQAAMRAGNALYGTQRAGAIAPEVAKYVTGYANQAYDTRIDQLLKASGALTSNPGAAGELLGMGSLQRNNAIGSGLSNLGGGASALINSILRGGGYSMPGGTYGAGSGGGGAWGVSGGPDPNYNPPDYGEYGPFPGDFGSNLPLPEGYNDPGFGWNVDDFLSGGYGT